MRVRVRVRGGVCVCVCVRGGVCGARGRRDSGYSTALRAITSRYHSALNFGVLFWVAKST